MKKLKGEEYGFSCGVIRSDEGRILSRKELNKILEANTLSQGLSILNELGYGEVKDKANQDLDLVLKSEMDRVKTLIEDSIPHKEAMNIVYIPKDYQNLKVILKAQDKEIPYENLLVEGGSIMPSKLVEIMLERNFSNLPLKMKEGLEEAITVFSKGKNPKDIDLILDKTCYLHMMEMAEEMGNQFLIDYVKLLIDLTNIKTYVRVKEIEGDEIYLLKSLIPMGNLEESLFKEMFKEEYSKMGEKLFRYNMDFLMEIALDKVRYEESYMEFEREIDNLKMDFVKKAKYVSVGIEPIIAYYLAKETEITNVRIILRGISSNLPKEAIAERMRETYV